MLLQPKQHKKKKETHINTKKTEEICIGYTFLPSGEMVPLTSIMYQLKKLDGDYWKSNVKEAIPAAAPIFCKNQ